jgi:hypothetical protein
MKLTIHKRIDSHRAQVLGRGSGNGLDTPYVIVEDDSHAGRMLVKVPGHKELSGYDRLCGGSQYTYVPVRRIEFGVVSRFADRYGHEVIDLEAPE